jgi:hypothetical protein
MRGGSSRNLGGSRKLHALKPERVTGKKIPGPRIEAPIDPRERTRGAQAINGIARAKETKRGKMAASRLSAFIVPVMRGNLTHRDPAEGRGASGYRTVGGEH